MRRLLAAALMLLPVAAEADPACHPIPAEQIDGQWAYYSALAGAHPNGGSDKYECILIPSTMQSVCRTKPASPAHPAISIRTLQQKDGDLFMRDEGETAGDCTAFLAMMAEFADLDRKIHEELERSRPAGN